MAKRTPMLAASTLAATALALARQLDDPVNSATSKSMCANSLRETVDRIRELLPAEEEGDKVDELASRRAARRAVASS